MIGGDVSRTWKGLHFLNRETEFTAGLFAESTVHWTPWLRTVTGVRADGFLFAHLHPSEPRMFRGRFTYRW